uniref:Large ribosomal subunit protein mL49 n=1 Tax=Catharus ustulatus TaxID=91951 RepID=A0A8C3V6T6_CATUS
MAALCRRLRALGRGVRGVQVRSPPGAPRYEESTAEFAFVERLLPPSSIPEPPPHPKYPTPSGWSPPAGPPPDLPYFVRRSRLHNLPVYLGQRQGRRLTALRHIHGDIWVSGGLGGGFGGALGVPLIPPVSPPGAGAGPEGVPGLAGGARGAGAGERGERDPAAPRALGA